jgi:predicted dehydrogenase
MIFRHEKIVEVPPLADFAASEMSDIRSFKPQAAVVANPAALHLDIARSLADIKCDLLIEKPLAAESENVGAFLAAVRSNDLICQIGYNLRFNRSLNFFRNTIKKGVIGNLLSVRCEVGQYLPDWRPATDYRTSVSARKELGGGVLLELSHEIDYLSWIFGKIKSVSAWVGHLSDLQVNVEDCAHLALQFDRENSDIPLIGHLSLDFIRRDQTRECVAIGSASTLRWNGITGDVQFYRATERKWETLYSHVDSGDDTYQAQWDHFLNCVRARSIPMIDGVAGYAVVQAIEAARRSAAKSGLWQQIQ